MQKNKKRILVAYVPVLHEGYRCFFEKNKDVEEIFVWGKDIIAEEDYLAKEIRALDPELIVKSLESWNIFEKVSVLSKKEISKLKNKEIVLPDEDVCRNFASKYLVDEKVEFDPIFLRWDRTNTKKEKKVGPEKIITENEFMNSAFKEAERSSDWWRQVGGVIVKDGKVILSYTNKHVPSPHQAYVDGDPRNVSHQGKDLDLYTTIHAEAGCIAEAAKKGIALDGLEMYVTDFPCPACAKQIAYAGIKKLYFTRGYAVLDGERILKQKGVKIIQIKK